MRGKEITEAGMNWNTSIVDRFRAIVAILPGQDAMQVPEGRMWTYEQLDRWSNQVAGALVQRMEQDRDPVAILLPTGPELIAAILGTLKTGRPYVAMTPDQPTERLRKLVDSTKPQVIIA